MTETGNSIHAASNLCHTSSTVLAGEEKQASISATHNQMFSSGDKCRDHASQGNNRITGTHLKRRHATPVSSFVVLNSRAALSLYAAFSRKVEVTIAVLTAYARGDEPLWINVPFFLKKCFMRYKRAVK
ncbi:hypothetical protein TNCV_3300081 [Trichonephila clavipes]|nr:hypothetical protein TNCV_3300081 [Trichonephila clavipes]